MDIGRSLKMSREMIFLNCVKESLIQVNDKTRIDVSNSGNSDSFIWYRCYFAAYNGANEATLQDLTLWIVTE